MSKTVAAAEFQAHSLELLEEVAANQGELVVLQEGKPLARVVPVEVLRGSVSPSPRFAGRG